MGRPLWLDGLYIAIFFFPPFIIAAAFAAWISRQFGLSGVAFFVIDLVVSAASLALWIAAFVVWERVRSRPSRKVDRDPE